MTRVCVCVPARDEAARLPILLEALARQTVDRSVTVALCINNSDDASERVVADIAARHATLDIHVDLRRFAPADAHAGSARRCAMDRGADLLGRDDGILISTDADCRPPPRWIEAIVAAMAHDRIVGGRIVIDRAETLSESALDLRRRWERYWEMVRGIEDATDPRSAETAGRHGDHTGASLAMSVGLYRAAGGVPPIPLGEDRTLVENAILAGGVLVHPADVWTWVSPRRDGRAAGGMAADMVRLAADAAARRSPRVPAFETWAERARWRRTVREEHGDRGVILAERELPPLPDDMPLPEVC